MSRTGQYGLDVDDNIVDDDDVDDNGDNDDVGGGSDNMEGLGSASLCPQQVFGGRHNSLDLYNVIGDDIGG